MSVSLSHQTSWTLYRSQSSTDLHQTCHQGRVPEDVVTYCFWWKSERRMSAKPEVELISPLLLWKNNFTVKYLLNGDRYYDGVNRSRIQNHPSAIDWHHDLWPWITLNCPSSRSLKLHVKYFKNGDRYDDGVNRSRRTRQPVVWIMGLETACMMHWADRRSIELISWCE